MKKTYKYRLLSNKETFAKAEYWLELCCNLYNACLEQRIIIYRQSKTTIHCYEQMNQLLELKEAFPEYKQVGSQTLQDVVERLDKVYTGYFHRIKNGDKAGFPRFRNKDRYDSFTLKQRCGWTLNGKSLHIHKIGYFKIRLSRPIEGEIKTVTIRRESTGKWYICFSCDNVPENKLEHSDKSIGIDVGLKSFCVDSENHVIDNLHHLKNSLALLRKRQRRLSRRVKGSNRRNKARILVAKAHDRVKNQRNDFLHKTANYYVRNYGKIYIEDLNLKGMVRNHHFALSISESGWGKFFELLSYKAEEAGRELVKVPRFEPTSKTCSECGAINQELTLNNRQWVCKSCGTLHDRDYNAAKNILRVGQILQEPTYANRQCVSCEFPKGECQWTNERITQ